MKAAADLFDDGRLSIVQAVGYPNPNRSHFESMSIWQHARIDTRQHDGNGWLGRTFGALPRRDDNAPDAIYVGNEAIPVAIRGPRANAVSLERESDLELLSPVNRATSPARGDDLSAFITRTQSHSFEAASRFEELGPRHGASSTYPSTALAHRLQLIARLIKLGGGTRVFYVAQGSYDTHSAQADTHRSLLSEFSDAVSALLNDLRSSQLDERVVVLAFSEFGRRVQENGSEGTDHGAAGPVFVAGGNVRGGLVGNHPSLTDLDQGDLKMAVDFRSVYATVLSDWLGIQAAPILGADFGAVDLLKT
jgi:uncharacterized protein (DUF1501 family)